MIVKATRRAHGRPLPDEPETFTTLVELTFQKQKVEHWIRFGRELREQILDRRRRLLFFPPGATFALVRWAAPVLVFTSEEVWSTRYPDEPSVHLLEWPLIDTEWREDAALETKWAALRLQREAVTEAIEPLRREKVVGSSLEAEITLPHADDPALLAELFIVSSVKAGDALSATKTEKHKCGRCWRHLPEVKDDGGLCARCEDVVNG